jgi:hypothetical protein
VSQGYTFFCFFPLGPINEIARKREQNLFTWPKSSDLFVTKPEIMSLEQIPIGSTVEAILDMIS